jgi:hypothetical protein
VGAGRLPGSSAAAAPARAAAHARSVCRPSHPRAWHGAAAAHLRQHDDREGARTDGNRLLLRVQRRPALLRCREQAARALLEPAAAVAAAWPLLLRPRRLAAAWTPLLPLLLLPLLLRRRRRGRALAGRGGAARPAREAGRGAAARRRCDAGARAQAGLGARRRGPVRMHGKGVAIARGGVGKGRCARHGLLLLLILGASDSQQSNKPAATPPGQKDHLRHAFRPPAGPPRAPAAPRCSGPHQQPTTLAARAWRPPRRRRGRRAAVRATRRAALAAGGTPAAAPPAVLAAAAAQQGAAAALQGYPPAVPSGGRRRTLPTRRVLTPSARPPPAPAPAAAPRSPRRADRTHRGDGAGVALPHRNPRARQRPRPRPYGCDARSWEGGRAAQQRGSRQAAAGPRRLGGPAQGVP